MKKVRNIFGKLASLIGIGFILFSMNYLRSEEIKMSSSDIPYLRIPKLAREPDMIEGPNAIDVWMGASGFCGLREANLPGAPFLGPDASWVFGYTDKALYISCMVQLAPQGEFYLAKTVENNDLRIFEDDHLEIQVSLDPSPGEGGHPYLRVAANPNGALWAATMEALPGQNAMLDTNRLVFTNYVGGAHIPGHWWVTKFMIPLDVLGVNTLDDCNARVHIAWGSPPLYLSWGGAKPDQWNKIPLVKFDPHTPVVFRLNPAYPHLFDRNGGIRQNLYGGFMTGTKESAADIKWVMRNTVGNKTVSWEKHMDAKGMVKEGFKLPWTGRIEHPAPDGNLLVMEAFAKTSPDGEEIPVFRNQLPFSPKDAAADNAYKSWKGAHHAELKAMAQFDYVYDPYTERVDSVVNTNLNKSLYTGDELQKCEGILASNQFKAVLKDIKGREIAQAKGDVKENSGHALLQLPSPLPDGDYLLHCELFNGNAKVDAAELKLTRQHFEWEKSKIGKDKVIIPPWEPVRLFSGARKWWNILQKDDVAILSVWGRKYSIGATGLPTAMVSQGEDVLGGPFSLECVVDGKTLPVQPSGSPEITLVQGEKFPDDFEKYEFVSNTCPVAGKDFQLEKTDGYAAEVRAKSSIGPLDADVFGRLDYDGFYHVRIILKPTENPVTVDALTLKIPISQAADLFRFNRNYASDKGGAVPSGEGVLFQSSSLPPVPGIKGNFVPLVFAGQYDHGLFWIADTDRGWGVDDESARVLLIREKSELSLCFRLITKPETVKAPREIEFAVFATPSRPRPEKFRYRKGSHDTAGFRFYGGGVNGFQIYTPEDYEGLRKFYYEQKGIAPHFRDQPVPSGHGNAQYVVRSDAAMAGHPLTIYNCTYTANVSMREWPTFGSSWCQSAIPFKGYRPLNEFKNMWNEGGTIKWTTPEQLSVSRTCVDESFMDCWLWHLTRIARFCGVNGCFFDCYQSYPFSPKMMVSDVNGVAYRRSDGHLQAFAIPLRYHERTRRFATALWLIGRPPAMLQSNNFDNTYGPTWYVEGDMYVQKPNTDLIDNGMTLERFAAFTASSSGMGQVTSNIAHVDYVKETNEQAIGVAMAFCLLHDIVGPGGNHWFSPSFNKILGNRKKWDDMLGILNTELHVSEKGAEFLRYWRPDGRVTVNDPRIKVGGYIHPDKACAFLIVINPTEEKIHSKLFVAETLLGRTVASVVDVVKDQSVASPIKLDLERHATRFLLVK